MKELINKNIYSIFWIFAIFFMLYGLLIGLGILDDTITRIFNCIAFVSLGITLATVADSFKQNEDNKKDKIEINNKLDKIISYYTSKEEIINQARQNKELYDLNLIDFDEYELKRLELKNRLKESNN